MGASPHPGEPIHSAPPVIDFAFPTLVQNAALLLAVAVVFDAVIGRLSGVTGKLPQIVAGAVLGVVGISLMLTPWEFEPGLFFDTRPVLLTVSGLFFGLIPTVVAMAMMIGFRMLEGGAAAWVGAAVVLVSGGLGLARRLRVRRLQDQSLRELWLFGLGAHVVVMLVVAVGLWLTLPADVASAALSAITVPVLVIYPVAAALLGGLLVNRLRGQRLAEANAELQAQVAAQLEDVRRSRARIVTAGDEERRRLERDIHDGAQQRLVALTLALRLARTKLGSNADPTVTASLEQASAEAKAALTELRELARGIHPQVLTQAGLAAAVETLADRSPIPVTVAMGSSRHPPAVEAAAYFVVSEALANAAKYSQATRVNVTSEDRDGRLWIEIADDGAGGADQSGGSGLPGLRDRVAALGGNIEVVSPLGGGTRLTAELPTSPHAEIAG
jgi:signal transduction histidine kinase